MAAPCEIAAAVGGFYFTETVRFRFHPRHSRGFHICRKANISLDTVLAFETYRHSGRLPYTGLTYKGNRKGAFFNEIHPDGWVKYRFAV